MIGDGASSTIISARGVSVPLTYGHKVESDDKAMMKWDIEFISLEVLSVKQAENLHHH